ncbi:MAG: hypothetical protein JNM84_10740 [Planctomycetes bacterium]|nr:hypothetical protein [Planctomycetota bacterium]
MHPSLSRGAIAAALLVSIAAGQESSSAGAVTRGDTGVLVPLHELPSGDAEPSLERLWAAGPDWKASFAPRFAFYPVLGREYPVNLPLCWTTTRCGRTEGAASAALPGERESCSPLRFERSHGDALVEAYDLRAEGVEQSFVLPKLPSGSGDLVIEGTVETPLRAAHRAPQHGELLFCDESGTPILSYGAAQVFDARGESAPVRSGWDGELIRLVVDEEFLRDAALPLVVDPLIRSVIIDGGSARHQNADLVRNDETNEICTTYERWSSATDSDAFARVTSDDLLSTTQIWADLGADRSTVHPRVAAVGGANRYAIAFERQFPAANFSSVSVYLHDQDSDVLNSGTIASLSRGVNEQDSVPVISGTASFTADAQALLVWRRDVATDFGNTPTSRVFARLLDASTATFGTQVGVGGNGSIDAEAPAVVRQSDGTGLGWVVAWQENASNLWNVLARRISATAVATTHVSLGSPSVGLQDISPAVDGREGRFLVAFVERFSTATDLAPTGSRISARRLDWIEGGSPSVGPLRVVVDAGATPNLSFREARSVAFDDDGGSLWMLAYRDAAFGSRAVRLGDDGLAAERFDVRAVASGETPHEPALCFDNDDQRFLIGFTVDRAQDRVEIAEYHFDPAAIPQRLGPTCGGEIRGVASFAGGLWIAGHRGVAVNLSSAPPGVSARLFASIGLAAQPIPLPLSPSGCTLLLDPLVLIEVASGVTNAGGVFAPSFVLPSTAFGVELYWQYLLLSPSGLASSDALRTRIR